MKKFWKIFGITLGSLVGLVLIVVVVALWLVFTPARLTPIVEKQLPRFVTCRAGVERVELTFFSSFPRLGLRIDGLNLVNPMEGAPRDTLVRLDRLGAAIDVKAFLKRDEVILSDIELHGGTVCLYADSLGRTNYDIVKSTPDADTTSTGGLSISRIDVDRLTFSGLEVLYADASMPMAALLENLSGSVKADMNTDARVADADLVLNATGVNFAYAGEEYLKDGAINLTAVASVDLAVQKATIGSAVLKLNDLEIALDGTVQSVVAPNDASSVADNPENIVTDIHYKFAQWPLEKIIELIPYRFADYIDGIYAAGSLSSEGTVKGVYTEGSMPTIDAVVTLTDGTVGYPTQLPWPLTDVTADIAINTDLSDEASRVTINNLSARTPRSILRARGTLDRLFSDPHAVLVADVSADIADARPFIPASLDVTATGKVSGRVNADVRMSQITSMALERMRLSGSLLVSDLAAKYDTIEVNTPSARLDFSLPNAKPKTAGAVFASLGLTSDRLDARMGDGASIALDGARLALETSDVRSTDVFPAVACDFAFEGLAARMDDMSVDVVAPSGAVSMEPGRRSATTQRFGIVWNSGALDAKMEDMTAVVQSLDVDARVNYDPSKPDIWQQLSPRGSIAAEGVKAHVPSLNYPVEVPALAMNVTPDRFGITEARVRLDESDFSLDGTIDNIAAYFRDEDILRAEFNFDSPVTNVSQLLALTSGLGDQQLEAEKASSDEIPADEFTGPYMVPKGIDIMLHANIGEMLWEGEPLISNLKGEIQVKDGALFITPEVSFNSPVTSGNIQLMYRTPAKNNLFAGVAIHLNRIDMAELVALIPDLDRMMPMLKGFSGTGEFHAAVEGYMDSTYNFKMSTIRGAGSIGAKDMALKDDELFRKIAVLLKYKDEGVIRVDSMRVEFTVLRDNIKVFPFLLKVDRYGAIISGQHNLDMNFDYNISLVESPLPFRVAVDIQGTPDDLDFKVFSKSAYPDFYRPKYEGVVENRQLELRNVIRDALLQGNKKEEDE